MVKKTIIAVVAVVLLVAVFAGAASRWFYQYYPYGYSYYMYYPVPYYPAYNNALSNEYPYAYNYPYANPTTTYPYYSSAAASYSMPTTSYPASPTLPLGKMNQLCGLIGTAQYGCSYGLVCDYTKTSTTGVGLCTSLPTQTTTFPYRETYPSKTGNGSTSQKLAEQFLRE